MATLAVRTNTSRITRHTPGETIHKIGLTIGIIAAAGSILALAGYGFPYYSLRIEERPYSPLHAQLRSSGTLGLKLAFVSLGMFCILFLYPLRKRWRWLSTIGVTRRWLNFHILFGITTPLIVTFHTSLKFHGVAGLAYWTMIAVAVSGFIGRYVYAKIPRSINSAKLTIAELETQAVSFADRLTGQEVFHAGDLAPLLTVPDPQKIRAMHLTGMLVTMLRLDIKRPFLVSRLRRRVLSPHQRIRTLGGLLPSNDGNLESIIAVVRRQSRLRASMAFLDRTQRVFHLWHVIHRPFSISFVALLLVHIGVAISVGF